MDQSCEKQTVYTGSNRRVEDNNPPLRLSSKEDGISSPPDSISRFFILSPRFLFLLLAIPAYLFIAPSWISLWLLSHQDGAPIASNPTTAPPDIPSTSSSSKSSPFSSVSGPLISSNFADPAIISVDGVSYAFATNNRGLGADMIHVQIATSTDNETWTLLHHHDALPKVGKWETGNRVWAPDVVQLDDGSFVLYYSDELVRSPQYHCIGAATSKTVMGPYTPLDTPFACPNVDTLGGAIDPDGFHDPSTNKRYVTYKIDGNANGHGGSCQNTVPPLAATPIMLQEVGVSGVSHLGGQAIEILDRDDKDGPLIEAPSLHRSDEGIYFLFYSSNCFTTPLYDIAYATATDVRGPYTRAARPLLMTGDARGVVGPGGMDIIKGGNLIVFHAHMPVNNESSGLLLRTQDAGIRGNKPVKDINVPLVRGMWKAEVTFKGHSASLAKVV